MYQNSKSSLKIGDLGTCTDTFDGMSLRWKLTYNTKLEGIKKQNPFLNKQLLREYQDRSISNPHFRPTIHFKSKRSKRHGHKCKRGVLRKSHKAKFLQQLIGFKHSQNEKSFPHAFNKII